MDSSPNGKCPVCGAAVVLPEHRLTEHRDEDTAHLASLARAACGCWVSDLDGDGAGRLLCAVIGGGGPVEDLAG